MNLGIQYALDRFYENCTMSAIQPGAFDSTLDFSELITRGSYVVKLKSPMDVFHLTPQMRFIGQVHICFGNVLFQLAKCIII